MEPLYHEQIDAGVAQQLLQDDFVSGRNMSYYLISELSNTVILQHDNDTGRDVEVTLPITEETVKESVPKIESYCGEYDTGSTSKYVIIQIAAIAFMALIAVVGFCVIYYQIAR